jgi:hypothetical protein
VAIDIRSVVNQAYQMPGIIALEEVASGQEAAIGVMKLNELVAQLNLDQLLPFTRKVVEVTGVQPQNTYTIGLVDPPVIADIAVTRPSFINRLLYYPNGNTMPMNIQQVDLPDLLFRRRTVSAIGTPMYFAVDGGFPLQTIYFDIKPQQGAQFTVIYNEPIPTLTINTILSAPPEYTQLLVCALARQMAVFKQMPADTLQSMDLLYKEAVTRIKNNNARFQVPLLDDMTGASNYRVSNIYTGNSSR